MIEVQDNDGFIGCGIFILIVCVGLALVITALHFAGVDINRILTN